MEQDALRRGDVQVDGVSGAMSTASDWASDDRGDAPAATPPKPASHRSGSEPAEEVVSDWAPIMKYVYAIPVFGWALECLGDDQPVVRRTGFAVLVMSVLLALLVGGRPEWVIPFAVVSGMLFAAYRVMR